MPGLTGEDAPLRTAEAPGVIEITVLKSLKSQACINTR